MTFLHRGLKGKTADTPTGIPAATSLQKGVPKKQRARGRTGNRRMGTVHPSAYCGPLFRRTFVMNGGRSGAAKVPQPSLAARIAAVPGFA